MNKLTPKQEKFCQEYHKSGSASDAYRKAYDSKNMKPSTVNRSAKELLDNRKIAARIDALQKSTVKRHETTVDDLLRELEEARASALMQETPQASAAVSATMGKAKLLGFDKSKIEVTGKLTIEDLVAGNEQG
jgi:phage terminase small subunit